MSIEERLHQELAAAVSDVSVDPERLARTAGRRGRRRRRFAVAASALLPAVAVAAIGALAVGVRPSPQPATGIISGVSAGPVLLQDGEPLLSCNTPDRFTPAIARNGVPQADPTVFVPAMQQHAKAQAWSMPEALRGPDAVARADWRVAAVSEHTALLLYGAMNSPTTFSLEKSARGWTVTSMGGCQAFRTVPSEPGRAWVDVSTGGSAGALSRESTTIKVNAIGSACATSPPRAVLAQSETAVVIYLTEPARSGGCVAAGRMQVVTITLAAPLGSRALLDGSVWPVRTLAAGASGQTDAG